MNGICERKTCFGFDDKKFRNHCSALSETYDNDFTCPFHKTKEQVAKERRKTQARLQKL